ncbi:uncharacterized protein [Nicotiana tomentosiformis]|uniref:uncharacterized protein n=1 Tax=Nicotiana tomentosiformis TaxID=4098 RepID=UPI00388CA538
MVRDCPRLRRGAPPKTTQTPHIPHGSQTSQVVVTTLVAAPHAQPARGGGQAGRGHPRGGGQARCYAFPGRTEAVASDAVITGIVRVCRRDAPVLFDPGSTNSYVSSYFALYFRISHDSLSSPVYMYMLVGDSIVVDCMHQSCLVVIGGFETIVDLLFLSMADFDVILGVDWLSPYHDILDCHAKTVTLAMSGLSRLEWRGTLDFVPPDRDIYFSIDLLLGTQPIFIPPYHTAPAELKELKE